jgi:DNA repair ATPase RecN
VTDTPYTNADLDAAEFAFIAAGLPEHARALRQYTEGIRNLVQGEWGQSFVGSLARILTTHLDPINGQMVRLIELAEANQTRLNKIETRLDRKRARLDAHEKRLREVEARLSKIERKSSSDGIG